MLPPASFHGSTIDFFRSARYARQRREIATRPFSRARHRIFSPLLLFFDLVPSYTAGWRRNFFQTRCSLRPTSKDFSSRLFRECRFRRNFVGGFLFHYTLASLKLRYRVHSARGNCQRMKQRWRGYWYRWMLGRKIDYSRGSHGKSGQVSPNDVVIITSNVLLRSSRRHTRRYTPWLARTVGPLKRKDLDSCKKKLPANSWIFRTFHFDFVFTSLSILRNVYPQNY